jgi:hypothetical protein
MTRPSLRRWFLNRIKSLEIAFETFARHPWMSSLGVALVLVGALICVLLVGETIHSKELNKPAEATTTPAVVGDCNAINTGSGEASANCGDRSSQPDKK